MGRASVENAALLLEETSLPKSPKPYTIPKDCGGYPYVRQCKKCGMRWMVPVSGEACPFCSKPLPQPPEGA